MKFCHEENYKILSNAPLILETFSNAASRSCINSCFNVDFYPHLFFSLSEGWVWLHASHHQSGKEM